MDISNLKTGIEFTAVVLVCFKLNGSKPKIWKEIGFNPSRQEDLFESRYMNFFKNDFAEELAKKGMFFPQVMAALRHKYINDMTEQMVSDGSVKQVIILGAGFDTRSQTYTSKEIKYFEIDSAEILNFKATIFKNAAIENNSVYLPLNYIEEDLIAHLIKAGVSPELETLFIWEGNSMYIPAIASKSLWGKIQKSFKKYHILMDYGSRKFIERETGIEEHIKLLDSFKAMDAHFITGYDNIEEFCNINNLKVMENFSFSELAVAYGVHNEKNTVMECGSVCLLSS